MSKIDDEMKVAADTTIKAAKEKFGQDRYNTELGGGEN
jgi:hypothetical protein